MKVSKVCFRRFAVIAITVSVAMGMTQATQADQPSVASGNDAEPAIQVRLESRWRDDPPPGVSLTFKGGGLIDRNFPAVSADRSHIALLYMAGHPELRGYPTFEVWSATDLKRLRPLQLVPGVISATEDHVNVDAPDVVATVERQLVEVNRILAKGGYRPMESFFDFSDWKTSTAEKWGMRIAVQPMEPPSDGKVFRVSPLQGGRDLLVLKLPRVIRQMGDDPMNSCGNVPYPSQGWYDPTLRIMVIRLINPGGSPDGCDLPEEWILKRL